MTAAPRPSAAALSGGHRSALVVLAGLVVGVAAACGSSAVVPSAGTTPFVASFPPASHSAAPSASAKADPATAAVKSFVALVTKDGFSYQATFSGEDRHSTDIFPVSKGLLQVSGTDVRLQATFNIRGHRYAVEHRYVDGKAWVRFYVGDAWRRLTFHASDSMGAFVSIRRVSDVTSLGTVKSGGKTYYQVSFRSAIVNPAILPFSNISDTSLKTPKLTLLIDAAGQPVRGTAEIDGRGRISGQLQEIVIDLKVAFTKIGQAVSIKAP